MGVWLTVGCYLVAFSPALTIFGRFIARDPLRIILFVLGAFFWLISLLLSSFFWLIISTFWDALPIAVGISILLQEAARVFYFWLLKKAQCGLNKMTRSGTASVAPGVSDLHNARHMLALVCGLGMGVIAALFLTMNVFAEFSGPGSIGLPKALKDNTRNFSSASSYLPFYYAISSCLLTLLNITWTIMVWDSCHKFNKNRAWSLPAGVALVSHYLISIASSHSSSGHHLIVLVFQLGILLACIIFSHIIMGGTFSSLGIGIIYAIRDWATLRSLRHTTCKSSTVLIVSEEVETNERNSIRT